MKEINLDNIKIFRDQSFSITIKDEEDEHSEITGHISTNKQLYIVKKTAIFLIETADEIDPNRTNSNIPNTYKKILNYGSDDDIVGRILLTADKLLDPKFNGTKIKRCVTIPFFFKLTELFTEMRAIKKTLSETITPLMTKTFCVQQEGSIQIPMTKGLKQSTELYIKHADDICDTVYDFLRIYNPQKGKGLRENLRLAIIKEHGGESILAKIFQDYFSFLIFVRECRNAMEHPKNGQKLKILDFNLTAKREIIPPTIELISSKVPPIEPTNILSFFNSLIETLLMYTEDILLSFCQDNLKMEFAGNQIKILKFNPGKIHPGYKNVRFSYGIYINNQLIPIG